MRVLSAYAWAIPMLAALLLAPPAARSGEHDELEAWLETPFRLQAGDAFILHFGHPAAPAAPVHWRLALLAPDGRLRHRWQGETALRQGQAQVRLAPGALLRSALPGRYTLRLEAGLRGARDPPLLQQRQIALGGGAPLQLAAAQAAEPAFDIYLGNMHSQTGHSDGGGPLDSCTGSQAPQSAPDGPAGAYAYARGHGLDFLLASEHNHMYDGSEGSDPNADPDAALALYRAGLAQAAAFNSAQPGFAALYGMEWGVISNGGHLNILNSPALLAWERAGDGRLMGDAFIAKGDYAALYTLMRARGWLGQFNHPAASQFRIGAQALAFSADGDEAMALCEVMNSAAFSANDSETEKRHSFYETTCQRLLEAGYHLAFSSNQDNHCANWGAAYGNRTSVLLPRGTPLTPASLLDAVRARRVFATMDKASSLILLANGHTMGERFVNQGPLTLTLQYSPGPARSGPGIAAIAIVHGIPGRHGTPDTTELQGGSLTLTPPPGEHYYYARLTQEDGRMLWSAPVWITQQP
jgi:hypothetical protein